MDPLQSGITAARQGRRAEARDWLHEAIRLDAHLEQAWLWLSTVVETDAEHRICLEQALAINPHNETTRGRLEDIAASGRESASGVPINRLSPQPPQPRPALPLASLVPLASLAEPASASAGPRPPRRLPPHLVAVEMLTTAPDAPGSDAADQPAPSSRMTAVALVGCLSVSAASGLVLLVGFLLLGWVS